MLVRWLGIARTEQAGAGELLDADGEAHVALAGLDRHDRRAQRGGAGGAGVGHVVDGDAGLADLLLELLADAAAAHQVAGGQHAHVLHRHAAVGQRGERGLRGQVDDVLVGVLAELGHVDAEDPDVVAHGVLLVELGSMSWVSGRSVSRQSTGSKP